MASCTETCRTTQAEFLSAVGRGSDSRSLWDSVTHGGGHADVSGATGGGVNRTNCALMVPDGVYQLKPPATATLRFDVCRFFQITVRALMTFQMLIAAHLLLLLLFGWMV